MWVVILSENFYIFQNTVKKATEVAKMSCPIMTDHTDDDENDAAPLISATPPLLSTTAVDALVQ